MNNEETFPEFHYNPEIYAGMKECLEEWSLTRPTTTQKIQFFYRIYHLVQAVRFYLYKG